MPEDDKQEKRPARVELRSDVLAGLKAKASALDTKWIIVGLVLLLLIVVGVLMWLLPGRSTGDDEGLFGVLPEALDGDRRFKISGLSGRSCDEANRRAIGVMLAADPITRPVSGFAEADMVFELPVLVSDVTRLLAVYQCGRPDDIGSVRSARHDYLFLSEGVDAIIGHWGGSYHALNRIAAGEFDTINALTNPFGAYFRKDHLPAPYNGFTTYENLWNALQKLKYRAKTEFDGYEFKDDVASEERPSGGTLAIGWPGNYRVHYEYDPITNRYQRFWGGVKQVDGGGERAAVAPSVVVIMRADNAFAQGPGGYNDVAVEGEGALMVYQDGLEFGGTWQKDERYKNDPIKFLDENGKPFVFTRGQVWVMVVEPHVEVTWELDQQADPSVSPETGSDVQP